LNNLLKDMEDEGIRSKSAFEYEFFLFNETPHSIREKNFSNLSNFTPGMYGYSVLRNSVHSDLYNQLLNFCSDMDMHLEGLHTETGPGVIEAAIMVDDSINSADKATLFKTFSKVLFQRNDLIANFMAKWSDQYPGQSGHIHTSLQDLDGKSLFSSKKDELSQTLIYFIGGLQTYMREFSVMIAPTVNSYKRLCPGAWAPINMTWGVENRTTAFRVIKGDSSSQRVENRLPGADSNPYLALAATLGAGFLGIKEKINPTDETIGGAYGLNVERKYQVPANLGEAATLFKNSQAAKDLFGKNFVNHFANTRIWEYKEFQKNRSFLDSSSISLWELQRYFEII
jgi:glutamine synthetase